MAKIYATKLISLKEDEILNITKGVLVDERLGNLNGECPECSHNEWWLYPEESVEVREGGKPYCECINCGYITHL